MTKYEHSRVGTAVLDGLIEGPLPPFENGEDRLRQWRDFARADGLLFHLSVDGPRFSLLPDSKPLPLAEYDDLQDRIRRAMEQLLQLFPEDLRTQVFSTVRSVEYRRHTQRQSLYLVTSRGIRAEDREVAWKEQEPPVSAPKRLLPLFIATGLVLLAVVVSAFVVDYPALWRKFRARYAGIDAKRIKVDGAAVSRYVVIKKLGADKTRTHLELEIRRGAAFPSDLDAYRAEEKRILEKGEIKDLLALHRMVVDGSLRAQYLDERGKAIVEREVSIRGLLESKAVRVRLPMKDYPDTSRLRFDY